MFRKIVRAAVLSTAAICILFSTTPPSSQLLAFAQEHSHSHTTGAAAAAAGGGAGASRDIASDLLGKMKDVFGKQKMKTAFANGVFADGVLDILHDISNQRFSSSLAQGYGEMNIRVLLFWARIYALSTEQFHKIQKNLMDLKDIKKCVEDAIATRNDANKVQLLALFDYAVSDSGNNIEDLLNNMLDDGGDHHADGHVHSHDGESIDAEDANRLGQGFIQYNDEKVASKFNLMKDYWASAAPEECAFIGETTGGGGGTAPEPFFISGGHLTECWALGSQWFLVKYLQHQMRWDFQLLHDENVVHSSSADPFSRRRALLQTLAPETCDAGVPNCILQIDVVLKHDPARRAAVVIPLVEIEATEVIQFAANSGQKLPYVNIVRTAEAEADLSHIQQVLATTEIRSVLLDFSSGVISLGYKDGYKQGSLPLFRMTFERELLNLVNDYIISLKMTCPAGNGAIMYQEKVFERYRVDKMPWADTTVTIPTHIGSEYHSFIVGDLETVNAADAALTAQVFTGAYLYSQQYFVNYGAVTVPDSPIAFTTSAWVSAGFDDGAYVWKFGVFSLLASGGVEAQYGFEFKHIDNNDVKRVLVRTDAQRSVDASGDLIGTNGLVAPALAIVKAGIATPYDLTDAANTPTDAALLAYLDTAPTSFFAAPSLVKEFELVLDIKNRRAGAFAINATWNYNYGVDEPVQRLVPLFELDLNCEEYVFRPIIMVSSAHTGVVLLNQDEDNSAANVPVTSLVTYWSEAQNAVKFSTPLASSALTGTAAASTPTGFTPGSGTLWRSVDTQLAPPVWNYVESSVTQIVDMSIQLTFNQTGNSHGSECFVGFKNAGSETFLPSDVSDHKLLISAADTIFVVTVDFKTEFLSAAPFNIKLQVGDALQETKDITWDGAGVATLDFVGIGVAGAAQNVQFLCDSARTWASGDEILLLEQNIFYG